MSVTTASKVQSGAHAAHFYRDDAELLAVVGARLAEALRDDATPVVIATELHVRAFERELETAGLGTEIGGLITLDAPATLAKLTVDGRISREAFRRIVGDTIRVAGEGGRPIWAYGEMVDLLWRAGDVSGAIELETLWNELIAELPFSLLCAYQSEAVEAPEHELVRGQVCRLHTAVSSAEDVSGRFEPEDGAPLAARLLFDEAVQRWGRSGTVVSDARLLLSELVTNAVVHARSATSVSICLQGSGLRLAVADESSEMPVLRSVTPVSVMGGRGLRIVAALASDWGVERTAAGKVVWAEL